jgi:hypothetical protein
MYGLYHRKGSIHIGADADIGDLDSEEKVTPNISCGTAATMFSAAAPHASAAPATDYCAPTRSAGG